MKLSPNQIQEELARVTQNNYRQFVKKVILRRVRGFVEEAIEFKYPVTALIGTNGGGKSTILGAVALAYKTVRPAQFFPKAFRGDETMAEWAIEYELIDRNLNSTQNTSRTARFAQSKWRRDGFPERHVEYIEIQRTVPAGELTKYKKFIGTLVGNSVVQKLNPATIQYAGAILDKDVSNYRLVSLPAYPQHKLYIYQEQYLGYSQFHFGAGEASIIATVDRIESAPENALILVEEVENGLHPVAVRLFVHYLQNVARRKRLQIVFTTHSQEAVDELPAEAIWATINRRLFNGQLSVESLRTITGHVGHNRVVFVEDEFVVEWVDSAIGWHRPQIKPDTAVIKAGGYPNVLTVCRYHNENPTIQSPAVALVDGDLFNNSVEKLPEFAQFIGDGMPESIVFDYIFDNRFELISLVRQRCLLAAFAEQRILTEVESARNAAADPHRIFSVLSERLDFHSALQIQSGMIDIFNERNLDFWSDVLNFIEKQ